MPTTDNNFSKTGFARSYLIPLLLIFVIPGFSIWFFHQAESDYDAKIRESVLGDIRRETDHSEEEREKTIEFFERVPMSRILASWAPELKGLRESITSRARIDYAVFRWAIRISAICILSGIAVFFMAGLSVIISLRSQLAQYWSLRIGWHILRLFSLLQVTGQGFLAIALSFYVTALWMELYFIKLIALAGFVVIAAVCGLIGAIFKKMSNVVDVEGELIGENDAPALWERIRRLAEVIGTEPPDHLIAGIDDNFFVTEMPIKVGDRTCEGRTLFISLSLLKNLGRTEAEAVLSHELAHFSGKDTLYSKKIGPLMRRYIEYMKALYAGGISRPVFHFMHFFWNLYQMSLGKLSRQREFRADGIAAQATSPEDVAGSLVKIVAYSSYRGEVENKAFGSEQLLKSVGIVERIESGFPEFANAFVAGEEIKDAKTAHPFDSHPTLRERFEAVGVALTPESAERALARPALSSWYAAIRDADLRERRQWEAYENRFKEVHELALTYRYLPSTPEEEALVAKHFPEVRVEGKKGGVILFNHRGITAPEYPDPVEFAEIKTCKIDETLGKKYFVAMCGPDGKEKKKIKLEGYTSTSVQLIAVLNRFHSRYMTAKEYQSSKNKE